MSMMIHHHDDDDTHRSPRGIGVGLRTKTKPENAFQKKKQEEEGNVPRMVENHNQVLVLHIGRLKMPPSQGLPFGGVNRMVVTRQLYRVIKSIMSMMAEAEKLKASVASVCRC